MKIGNADENGGTRMEIREHELHEFFELLGGIN